MRNLDNFRQAVESPKSWNSMSYICLKTTFLHLKHYLQIYVTLISTYLWFGKWYEEYGKFSPEHLKLSKLGFWWDSLIQNWKSMSSKSTEELSVMTMKNDPKLKEKLTCHFKVDMRNLTNFDWSTWKSQKILFECAPFEPSILFELKKCRGVILHEIEYGHKYLERNWLVVSKLT